MLHTTKYNLVFAWSRPVCSVHDTFILQHISSGCLQRARPVCSVHDTCILQHILTGCLPRARPVCSVQVKYCNIVCICVATEQNVQFKLNTAI